MQRHVLQIGDGKPQVMVTELTPVQRQMVDSSVFRQTPTAADERRCSASKTPRNSADDLRKVGCIMQSGRNCTSFIGIFSGNRPFGAGAGRRSGEDALRSLLSIPGSKWFQPPSLAERKWDRSRGYANANAITGRSGLYPSRYQSDQTDSTGAPHSPGESSSAMRVDADRRNCLATSITTAARQSRTKSKAL